MSLGGVEAGAAEQQPVWGTYLISGSETAYLDAL